MPHSSRSRFARVHARFYFWECFAILQALLAHVVLRIGGFDIGGMVALADSFRVFFPQLLIQLVVGVAARSLWALFRKDRRYFRAIASWSWALMTLRILVGGVLVVHAYGWLKMMVPYLNPNNLDQQLWNLDRAIFLGMSPNVFLLNAFSNFTLLRSIDYLYGHAFFFTLLLSGAIFLSSAHDRIRVAYASGNAVLWIAGAWLYVFVPALGPAFRFPEVWESVSSVMVESRAWQYKLMHNYQLVLQLGAGKVSPELNMFYGVAAFPSLHVGFQAYVALWVGSFSRYLGIIFRLGVIVLFIGSIVTGWHYLIDAVAGAVMAIACYWATWRLFHFDRWRRLQALKSQN